MGKGTIVSGGTGGKYQVKINYDREYCNSELIELASKIVEYTAKILIETVENRKAALIISKLSFEKRKQYLENNMPKDATVSAWCADLTEDLTGEVGTVEVPGETTCIQIQPGHNDNSKYNQARDGVLIPMVAQTPFQAFYNLATLPGWQKWMPTFRHATVTDIKIGNDTASITMNQAPSSQQGLNTNKNSSYSDVPIEYMTCNSRILEEGDIVIVDFSQDPDNPIIMGFAENPRECCWFANFASFSPGIPTDPGGLTNNPVYDQAALTYHVESDTSVIYDSGSGGTMRVSWEVLDPANAFVYITFSAFVTIGGSIVETAVSQFYLKMIWNNGIESKFRIHRGNFPPGTPREDFSTGEKVTYSFRATSDQGNPDVLTEAWIISQATGVGPKSSATVYDVGVCREPRGIVVSLDSDGLVDL